MINLDPAVSKLPYGANIDIRDTIKYKNVMKQYNLGPNGGILTSLNLFATKFDQVMDLCEKRASTVDYILVDTPGQIEVFNWSASGSIMLESLASAFPTVVVYVVDTPRSASPTTFMSNMLYACSVLYKTRLPIVLVFNKIDIIDHSFAVEWMTDYETFQTAVEADKSYSSTLTRSMSLVLEEFYKNLRVRIYYSLTLSPPHPHTPSCRQTCGVSAVTGAGIDDFFRQVQLAAADYQTYYKVELEKRVERKKKTEEARKADSMERLKRDLEKAKGDRPVLDATASKRACAAPLPYLLTIFQSPAQPRS